VAISIAPLLVSGVWAAWTQALTTVNEYKTGKYSTEIQESFTPPDGWLPGQRVEKRVSLANTGTVPVFVKAVIHQEWSSPSALTFDPGTGAEYAALIDWGDDVVLYYPGMSMLATSLPTAPSLTAASGKWLLMSDTPDAAGNLTAYYVGVLPAGSSTPQLIKGVILNEDIEARITEKHTYYDKTVGTWVTTEVTNPTHSYENAHYTLGVTMHSVQAVAGAVDEMFTAPGTAEQSVISYLSAHQPLASDIDYSYDDTVTVKRLSFRMVDGVMQYTPSRGVTGENWFMSHLNMVPGGTYTDTMEIVNYSGLSFSLYLQAVPRMQTADQDALLALIHMKVYYGGTLIYDGTAAGLPGSVNLRNAVYLGAYAPGATNQIRVELTLDKNTPLAYADLLTQIDWLFVSEEIEPPVEPEPEVPPPVVPEPETVVPGTPEATPPAEVTPPTEITTPDVPLAGRRGWSLLSLILSVTAAGIAALIIARGWARKEEADEMWAEDEEKEMRRRKRRRVLRPLAVAIGFFTGILWLILDDLTLPMVWINEYTLFVAIAFLVFFLLWIWMAFTRREVDDIEEQDEATRFYAYNLVDRFIRENDGEDVFYVNRDNRHFRGTTLVALLAALIGAIVWVILARSGRASFQLGALIFEILFAIPMAIAARFDRDWILFADEEEE
jgi:alternate signal-mediated exported protein